MKITTIREKTEELQIPVDDEVLTVRYRPNAILLKDQAIGAGQAPEEVAAYLARVLAGWDLVDDAGDPVGQDAETLLGLPAMLLGLIASAIGEDIQRPLVSGSTSSDGSSMRGR